MPPAIHNVTRYRQVFESDEFPIAVLAMFPALPIKPHRHENFYELVFVISGSMTHTFGKAVYTLNAGDVLLIPPEMFHGYSDCENCSYYNLLIDFRKLNLPMHDFMKTQTYQKLFRQLPESCNSEHSTAEHFILNMDMLDRAAAILEHMNKAQTVRNGSYQLAMISGVAALLVILCETEEAAQAANEVFAGNFATLAVALNRHCEDNWTIQRICRLCNLSRAVLFKEFQKCYQVSPIRYLNMQRIRKAMSLLVNSDLSIEVIARQCGFSGSNYFSTAFRKETGLSPLNYRRSKTAGSEKNQDLQQKNIFL